MVRLLGGFAHVGESMVRLGRIIAGVGVAAMAVAIVLLECGGGRAATWLWAALGVLTCVVVAIVVFGS